MTARMGALLMLLWLATLMAAYLHGASTAHNSIEAAKVPAIEKAIARHNLVATAGQKIEVAAVARAAKTETHFQKIENEVIRYVQTHPIATDCSMDSDGLRIWRAANRNAESDTTGEPDEGVPAAAGPGEREPSGSAIEPRAGGEAVSLVPGPVGGLREVDGERP